jgi:predicted transcriptional regulator
MHRYRNCAALVALIPLLLAASRDAGAQTVDIQAAMRQPAVQAAMRACAADRDRLCASVIPGNGRIVRCLAAQPAQLSPTCKSAMEQARDNLVAAGIVSASAH